MWGSLKVAVLLIAMAFAGSAFAAKALTNSDVIKLSKLGLGTEAVTAKIRESAEVDFNLETDDLVKLKQAGVESKVIAAMLDRVAPRRSASASAQGDLTAIVRGTDSGADDTSVKVIPADGGDPIALRSVTGNLSTTYAFLTLLTWLNFPDTHASVRLHAGRPSFVVASEQDPRNRYYIVRLDVNDKDRSLKIGSGSAFRYQSIAAPDPDWSFDYEAAEQARGTWVLKPKKNLSAGEYGVFFAPGRYFFDFGVD